MSQVFRQFPILFLSCWTGGWRKAVERWEKSCKKAKLQGLGGEGGQPCFPSYQTCIKSPGREAGLGGRLGIP